MGVCRLRPQVSKADGHIAQTLNPNSGSSLGKARDELVNSLRVHKAREGSAQPLGLIGTESLEGVRHGRDLPWRQPRRSAISSLMEAMNSSSSCWVVSPLRSRTETLPASTSRSPRISM